MAARGTMDEQERLRREVERWRGARQRHPKDVPRPGPGEESVWDYPRPPRLEPVARRVRVELLGRRLADSTRALRVLETASAPTVYVPPEDVDLSLLVPEASRSFCEWKGEAHYRSARIGERVVRDVAWSYPKPFPSYARIAGWLSFFPARVECFLGDDRALPQPGGFYGGWVTPGILGPFKGDPGSEGW